MKTYPKWFINMSLVFLTVAAVFGLGIAIDPVHAGTHRFMHIHFLFLGFMLSLGAGLAYELLPRMANTSIRWPGLIPLHFWLANAALCGKAGCYLMRPQWGDGPFAACAVVMILTLALFTINVAMTLHQGNWPSERSWQGLNHRAEVQGGPSIVLPQDADRNVNHISDAARR